MLNFCTLFDSNYLPQGLAMYESLEKHCKSFHLFIFAFDDKCYEILNKLSLENVTLISLAEFEDEKLLEVKPTRTKCEYCWTCTPSTVLYCLKNFNLDHCTYIDADIYFYSDPQVLIDEMEDKSILLTEHRFPPESDTEQFAGKYNVQFIMFKNNSEGLEALTWWRDRCIEWCFFRVEDGKCGDQKYLDDWTIRFNGIHELQHLGSGLGSWNIMQYDIYKKNNSIYGIEKKSQKYFDAVFYHFHDVKFDQNKKLNVDYLFLTKKIRLEILHKPYLNHIKKISIDLKKIDNSLKIYNTPMSNLWYVKRFLNKLTKIPKKLSIKFMLLKKSS
ncbi:MAG: glycosyl transferase [Candidatus Melainabacteria bacterium RIFOXYA12_FULL_32_12]|nr:MAG: glycosyl transferase [Candidatus Melainabacteria bacterium RIFOXYA12_FULL_32_12]